MKQKPLWLKWIFCLIPLVLALIMYILLPLFPTFTEYVFSRGIFRILSFPLQWLMSLLPFSFAEAVFILALPLIITPLTIFTIKIVKSQNKIQIAEKGLRFTAWCLSIALLTFMVTHGANYHRQPIAQSLNLPSRQYTAEDLYIITCDLADKAAAARQKLPEDQNGCVTFSIKQTKILKQADNAYDNISQKYTFLKTGVHRVKTIALSHYLSYTSTTGIYCPWTGEANVNTDVPQYSIPYTAAHEVAHTMGIAKEDECNFLAFLACHTSSLPDFEYSGYLSAYTYCINTLYDADKELFAKAAAHCSDGMIRDLKNEKAYWKNFQGKVMEASQNINDSFIKANGDHNGVLSYDLMVELLLRYYDIDVI